VPAAAEEVMVARDLNLARQTGGRLHLLHLSTAGSVNLVRAAKARGLAVTAEATPHHLVLTDAAVAAWDPVFKVNPPLRSGEDVEAVRAGLVDGTLDAIATDHAPHPLEAKEAPFDQAPPGMIGLETALAVALTFLTNGEELDPGPGWLYEKRGLGPSTPPGAHQGGDHPAQQLSRPGEQPRHVSPNFALRQLLGLLSWKPAAIAGLSNRHGGPIAPGAEANLCVIDPAAEWVVEPARLASRSSNTPFVGCRLKGRVRHTIYRGEAVVIDAEAQR
jgi:dihydroorotase